MLLVKNTLYVLFTSLLLFCTLLHANNTDVAPTEEDFYVKSVVHKSYSDLFEDAQVLIKEGKYGPAYDEKLALCKSYGPCQALIGFMYHRGYYFDQNATKAIKWFVKADENGVKEARYNLGSVYLQEKEYCKAHDSFNAIEDKSAMAYYNLGLIYLYGWCVDQNLTRVREYMNLGLVKGYKPAKEVLNYLDSLEK